MSKFNYGSYNAVKTKLQIRKTKL